MINQYSVNEKITTKYLEYKQYFLDKTRFLEKKKIRFEDKISKYFYHMYNAETKMTYYCCKRTN